MTTFNDLAIDVAGKPTPEDAVKAMLDGIATMIADARATGNPAAVENLQIQLVQNSPALVAAVSAKPETAKPETVKAAPVAHVPVPVEPASPEPAP